MLLYFRMFPPWKFEWKLHLFCFPRLCCVDKCFDKWQKSLLYLCTNICSQKEILIIQPGFLKWKFQRGGVPTETIPLFLLALLQTNVQSHPGPASTDTFAWFLKGWRSRVLKGVTLRHSIKHIQKSQQDQKTQAVISWHPLGPNLIIFTSIY